MTEFGASMRDKIQTMKTSDDVKLGETEPTANVDLGNHYYISEKGQAFAGRHLLIDLFGASKLDHMDVMEQCLRDCVTASGATLLHIHLHHFEPNGGISGVAVLAESHISVHSWPETGYCAFDAFMCGQADPYACIDVMKAAFKPEKVELTEALRGRDIGGEAQS